MTNFNFEEFIAPYKDDLFNSGKSRYHNYEYVIKKLVEKNKPLVIIETGTMWSGIEDNMGAFTLVFADLIKNWTGGKLITIDISEKSINNCKETTKDYADVIDYVLSDSVAYLKSMTDEEVKNVDYIYFDSYDLFIPDPTPSQLHHYRELDAVYSRLSDDIILSVDDNFLPNTWVEWHTYDKNTGDITDRTRYDVGNRILGKGTLIDLFLLQEGWKRYDDFLHIDTVHLLTYEKSAI
jgi:predicted O-methyltransferase YrrM